MGQNPSKKLQINDLENLFLARNYQLIAQKYAVDKAQAEIIQAKLWANPTLTFSQINLWASKNTEQQPYIVGNFGNHQQLVFDLEQVIETAGERRKRMAVKSTEKELASLDFERLINELKLQLRTDYYSLQKIELVRVPLQLVAAHFAQLSTQFKDQVDKGNFSKGEYYRIQTSLITVQKQLIDLSTQETEYLQELKIITQLPDLTIDAILFTTDTPTHLYEQTVTKLPSNWMDSTLTQRISTTQLQKSQQQLLLEKAIASPNVNVSVGYERAGNIMRDFIGFGVGFDLPIVNRNQGNIKIARLEIEQAKVAVQSNEQVLNESLKKYQTQLQQYENLLQALPVTTFDDFRTMLENYLKYYKEHQISLLELTDFANSYIQAYDQYCDLYKEYRITYEKLQYLIGKDL